MATKTIFILLLLQIALTWHSAEASADNVRQQKLALNLDGKTLTLTFRPGNREGLNNSGPVIKEARKIPEEVDIVAFKSQFKPTAPALPDPGSCSANGPSSA